MSTNGYYDLPTNTLVFNLIKEANPDIDFSEDQVRLANMVTNPGTDTTRNTQGVLMAIPGMGREGNVTLTWNRPDIGEIFSNISVYVGPANKLKKSDLLAEINSNFSFQLAAEDIYDEILNLSVLPTTVSLRIRPTCASFVGELPVTLGDPKKALDTVIRSTDLAGLNYPTNQSVKIQGPFYLYAYDYSYDAANMQQFGFGDAIEGDLLLAVNRKSPDQWVNTTTPGPWNMNTASVWYNGVTSAAPDFVNTNYDRCVIIHLDSTMCTNVAGHLIMHYNVS